MEFLLKFSKYILPYVKAHSRLSDYFPENFYGNNPRKL